MGASKMHSSFSMKWKPKGSKQMSSPTTLS
ncbi:BnaA09g46940D [Brassica napus]|uniref:BnaA09g46940D protein n=1 Tax=Brassica napus TaxID=3708 RepID=A0A078GPN6_BRANA|nr:BnaA09g46940D [Brassica napus]